MSLYLERLIAYMYYISCSFVSWSGMSNIIVSRILALFGKYRISRYQGNLARFLWSQLPSLKYSLSLSSGSTGCSHLRKTVWLGKSWQSINYLEVTNWLFSIYSKNTLQVQYFANSPSDHLSSILRAFFSWNFPQLILSGRNFCKLGYFTSSLISSTCDVSKHGQYLLSAGLNIPYIFLNFNDHRYCTKVWSGSPINLYLCCFPSPTKAGWSHFAAIIQ